jgi:hypothetical protein
MTTVADPIEQALDDALDMTFPAQQAIQSLSLCRLFCPHHARTPLASNAKHNGWSKSAFDHEATVKVVKDQNFKARDRPEPDARPDESSA